MADGSRITIELSPASRETLRRAEALAVVIPDRARYALRAIVGWQLREAIKSWRIQGTPGGAPWAPNSPAVEEYKRVVLGQTPPMIGVMTGQLKGSPAAEVNEAALEGRVGSTTPHAARFHARRPFLPAIDYAQTKARSIVDTVYRTAIRDLGLQAAGGNFEAAASLSDLIGIGGE